MFLSQSFHSPGLFGISLLSPTPEVQTSEADWASSLRWSIDVSHRLENDPPFVHAVSRGCLAEVQVKNTFLHFVHGMEVDEEITTAIGCWGTDSGLMFPPD